MKRVFRRPSPAMVVAIVALLAALGGTAVGAGVLNKKKVKKIANNQITQRAPGLSVASAKTAAPSGPASGDLSGNYPNPTIANGVVGTSETGTIPAVRVFNTALQNIPGASTPTFLSFDSEQFDTAAMHSTSSSTDTLTAPVDGIYEVGAWIQWSFGGAIDSPTPSLSAIIIASNGARVADSETISLATNTVQNLSGLLKLSAGDTVKLSVVNANSTAAGVIGSAGAGLPSLSMAWVGPPGP